VAAEIFFGGIIEVMLAVLSGLEPVSYLPSSRTQRSRRPRRCRRSA
jgi:hypothetical protein